MASTSALRLLYRLYFDVALASASAGSIAKDSKSGTRISNRRRRPLIVERANISIFQQASSYTIPARRGDPYIPRWSSGEILRARRVDSDWNRTANNPVARFSVKKENRTRISIALTTEHRKEQIKARINKRKEITKASLSAAEARARACNSENRLDLCRLSKHLSASFAGSQSRSSIQSRRINPPPALPAFRRHGTLY